MGSINGNVQNYGTFLAYGNTTMDFGTFSNYNSASFFASTQNITLGRNLTFYNFPTGNFMVQNGTVNVYSYFISGGTLQINSNLIIYSNNTQLNATCSLSGIGTLTIFGMVNSIAFLINVNITVDGTLITNGKLCLGNILINSKGQWNIFSNTTVKTAQLMGSLNFGSGGILYIFAKSDVSGNIVGSAGSLIIENELDINSPQGIINIPITNNGNLIITGYVPFGGSTIFNSVNASLVLDQTSINGTSMVNFF